MKLAQAIRWAEKQSSRYLTYHVILWNKGYSTVTEQQLKRYKKDARSVYNTKDKKLNWDLIPGSNKFNAFNEKIREEILLNNTKIEPTFICKLEFPAGPKVGTIIKPYYYGKYNVCYRYVSVMGNTVEMSRSRMDRLCVYFKKYDKSLDDPQFLIDEKEPLPKKNRFTRLFAMAK